MTSRAWWWLRRHAPAEAAGYAITAVAASVTYHPFGPVGAAVTAQLVGTAAFYTPIIAHDLLTEHQQWRTVARRLIHEFGWPEAVDNVLRTLLVWAGLACLLTLGVSAAVAVPGGTTAGNVAASAVFYGWAGWRRTHPPCSGCSCSPPCPMLPTVPAAAAARPWAQTVAVTCAASAAFGIALGMIAARLAPW